MATTSVTTSKTSPGTSRASLALFAASSFAMLSALILLMPFAVSSYAEHNALYTGNLIAGLSSFFSGCLLFAISLAGLGLRPLLAMLITLASCFAGVVLWLGSSGWAMSTYTDVAMVATLIFLVLSWIIACDHHRLALWRRGLTLSLAGSGVLALLYLRLGGRHFTMGGIGANWPPYLTLPLAGITAGLAIVIFVLGWIWDETRARREIPARPTPFAPAPFVRARATRAHDSLLARIIPGARQQFPLPFATLTRAARVAHVRRM